MMTEEMKTRIISMKKEGMGYGEISRRTGCNKNTIKSFYRRFKAAAGLREKDTALQQTAGFCRNCVRELEQIKNHRKRLYCSDRCRYAWNRRHPGKMRKFICANCGKAFEAYGKAGRKYCCHECYIRHRFK